MPTTNIVLLPFEREIMHHAALGLSMPQIAEQIGLSRDQTRHRLRVIYLKLGANNIAGAVGICMALDLILRERVAAAYVSDS